MPVRKYEKITPKQLEALKYYAENNGRYWKRILMKDWRLSRAGKALQPLKDINGPMWLKEFKFVRPDVTKKD